jgi:hypothetical protein
MIGSAYYFSFAFGSPCSKPISHVVKALAPLALASIFSKIVSTLQVFHLSISLSPCPHSLMDFQPNGNLELSLDSL